MFTENLLVLSKEIWHNVSKLIFLDTHYMPFDAKNNISFTLYAWSKLILIFKTFTDNETQTLKHILVKAVRIRHGELSTCPIFNFSSKSIVLSYSHGQFLFNLDVDFESLLSLNESLTKEEDLDLTDSKIAKESYEVNADSNSFKVLKFINCSGFNDFVLLYTTYGGLITLFPKTKEFSEMTYLKLPNVDDNLDSVQKYLLEDSVSCISFNIFEKPPTFKFPSVWVLRLIERIEPRKNYGESFMRIRSIKLGKSFEDKLEFEKAQFFLSLSKIVNYSNLLVIKFITIDNLYIVTHDNKVINITTKLTKKEMRIINEHQFQTDLNPAKKKLIGNGSSHKRKRAKARVNGHDKHEISKISAAGDERLEKYFFCDISTNSNGYQKDMPQKLVVVKGDRVHVFNMATKLILETFTLTNSQSVVSVTDIDANSKQLLIMSNEGVLSSLSFEESSETLAKSISEYDISMSNSLLNLAFAKRLKTSSKKTDDKIERATNISWMKNIVSVSFSTYLKYLNKKISIELESYLGSTNKRINVKRLLNRVYQLEEESEEEEELEISVNKLQSIKANIFSPINDASNENGVHLLTDKPIEETTLISINNRTKLSQPLTQLMFDGFIILLKNKQEEIKQFDQEKIISLIEYFLDSQYKLRISDIEFIFQYLLTQNAFSLIYALLTTETYLSIDLALSVINSVLVYVCQQKEDDSNTASLELEELYSFIAKREGEEYIDNIELSLGNKVIYLFYIRCFRNVDYLSYSSLYLKNILTQPCHKYMIQLLIKLFSFVLYRHKQSKSKSEVRDINISLYFLNIIIELRYVNKIEVTKEQIIEIKQVIERIDNDDEGEGEGERIRQMSGFLNFVIEKNDNVDNLLEVQIV